MPDYTKRIVIESKNSWQRPVLSRVSTLPETPSKGDRYLNTTDNKICMYDGTSWLQDTPVEGWFVWVLDENKLYNFNGTDWVEYPIHTHNNKEILDAIEVALTNDLKNQYDEAYNKRANYDADLGVIYFDF